MTTPWQCQPPTATAEVETDDDDFLMVEKWPRDVYGPHYHEEWNWIVPMRPGRVVVAVEEREHAIDSNHWLCVFPRTVHRVVHVSDECEVLSLFIADEAMARAYREVDPPPALGPRCIVGGAGTIAQGLALAWGDLRFKPRVHDPVDEALERFVAGWIWRAYAPLIDPSETWELKLLLRLGPTAEETVRFLDAHLAENPFPWESLAERVGLSRRTLQRRFFETLGVSPSAVLTGVRLERGHELLRDPERAIADVALACGFASQSHFSTAFKAEYGLSPARHRAEVLSRTRKPTSPA